jgi:hypothetical protein
VSANRARGTRAESAVVAYLREAGAIHAERRSLNGANDRGDVAGIPGVVIEVKDHARISLAEFVDEAERESWNGPVPEVGVAWIKRRGKGSPGEWYVAMTGDTFRHLLHASGYLPRPE